MVRLGLNVVGVIEGDVVGTCDGIRLGMDVSNLNVGEGEGTAGGVVLGNIVVGKGVGESDGLTLDNAVGIYRKWERSWRRRW